MNIDTELNCVCDACTEARDSEFNDDDVVADSYRDDQFDAEQRVRNLTLWFALGGK